MTKITMLAEASENPGGGVADEVRQELAKLLTPGYAAQYASGIEGNRESRSRAAAEVPLHHGDGSNGAQGGCGISHERREQRKTHQ
jgi:hypothetical protein